MRIYSDKVYATRDSTSEVHATSEIGRIKQTRYGPMLRVNRITHWSADDLQAIVDRLRELESEPVKAREAT